MVFVGDSITGQGGNHPNGWVAQIGKALKKQNAKNRQVLIPLGGSGQTVGSWRNVEKKSRGKSVILDVKKYDLQKELSQDADVLVIMLGVNDVHHGPLKDSAKRIDQWKRDYRELIAALRERISPRVIALATPTPYTEDPQSPKNKTMEIMVENLQAIASDEKCLVLPVRETAWEIRDEGRKRRLDFRISGDGIHPNGYGHQAIAAGMLKGLGQEKAAESIRAQARKAMQK